MDNPHQRKGSKSNSHVGKMFEIATQMFFKSNGLSLDRNVKVPVGIDSITKPHAFDLGCPKQKVIVECKSHRWTTGGNDRQLFLYKSQCRKNSCGGKNVRRI